MMKKVKLFLLLALTGAVAAPQVTMVYAEREKSFEKNDNGVQASFDGNTLKIDAALTAEDLEPYVTIVPSSDEITAGDATPEADLSPESSEEDPTEPIREIMPGEDPGGKQEEKKDEKQDEKKGGFLSVVKRLAVQLAGACVLFIIPGLLIYYMRRRDM